MSTQAEWDAQFPSGTYTATDDITIINGASLVSHGAVSPSQLLVLSKSLTLGSLTQRGTLLINGLMEGSGADSRIYAYGNIDILGGSLSNVAAVRMLAATQGQDIHVRVQGTVSTEDFDLSGSPGQRGQVGGAVGAPGSHSLAYLQGGTTTVSDRLELTSGAGGERDIIAGEGQGGRGGMAALYLTGGSLTVKSAVLNALTSNSGMALLEVDGGSMEATDITLTGGRVSAVSEQAGAAELRALSGSVKVTGATRLVGGAGAEGVLVINALGHSGEGVLRVSGGTVALNTLDLTGGNGGNGGAGDTGGDGGDGAMARLLVSGGQVTVSGATTASGGAAGSSGTHGIGGQGGAASVEVSGGTLALDGGSTWNDGASLNISGGNVLLRTDVWNAGSTLFMSGGTLTMPAVGTWNAGSTLQIAGGTALMGITDLNAVPAMIPGGVHRGMLLINSAGLGNNTADMQAATLHVGAGTQTFNAGSLTMMDAGGLGATTAVLTVDSASFSPQSTLQAPYEGKKFGDSFTALTANSSLDGQWGRGITNSYYMGLAQSRSGNSIVATYVRDFMPSLSDDTRDLLEELFTSGADLFSPSVPVAFLTRATDRRYVDSEFASAATVEGALHSALLAGTQGLTLTASNMRAEAVEARVGGSSLSSTPIQDSSGVSGGSAAYENGLALWLSPLYRTSSVWNRSVGMFDTGYTAQWLGLVVGADYTFDSALRLGMALGMGQAHSASQGDFNSTTGKSNYWGASLYGGWRLGNWNLAADAGYTSNFTNVRQDIPASIGMGDLKADVRSSALTGGMRAEYRLETSLLDIIPHVGARWTQLHTEGHTARLGGADLAHTAASTQNLWAFPLGVALEKRLETEAGWNMGLRFDVGATAAAGDRKAVSKTSLPGLSRTVEMRMDLVDPWALQGGLGLEARKNDLTLNLNYTVQASPHSTAHGLYGTVAYEF